MAKLSAEKRLIVYKEALSIYQKNKKANPTYFSGLCNTVSNAATRSGQVRAFNTAYDYMSSYYPEIQKHKPHVRNIAYWFPKDREGNEKRIAVLKQAISEVQVLIKNS